MEEREKVQAGPPRPSLHTHRCRTHSPQPDLAWQSSGQAEARGATLRPPNASLAVLARGNRKKATTNAMLPAASQRLDAPDADPLWLFMVPMLQAA